ncbi:alpha-glucosidase [Gracilibacillus halophilus YIM-C55.5]|uniref:alpha-D-xyloside xylohydrolase n=1 Tax=Gracilibacillus halophilus YIM-C55.5 TaxID=1308866 RepID=N4WGV9_9BACI|nr:alpha-xylosidase [Gracilibacillus halophilus]ENH98479.1 alpha-glucosidase [Gracilibacillus halophilus YIM-C55.5]
MKFTNGNWLVRDGYEIHFPKIIHEVIEHDEAVTLYAPCKQINHRGDTLDGPLLTIRLSAPTDQVIRVQTWHFSGVEQKSPQFSVLHQSRPVQVTDHQNEIRFASGDLVLKIDKQNFGLSFYDVTRQITEIDGKGLAWIDGPGDQSYMRGQLRLGVGEYIYGLGERFTPFIKNGQTVDIWNEDGGTSSEQSYKNIPFYVSNKGYGVFVNQPDWVSYEIGSEVVSRIQYSVEGEYMDYYFFNGPSPKDVITRYTELTGKPALPPAWSFGLWLSTSFTTDYNEQTVNHFIDGMAERGIPVSVFHFDCFWMKAFEWTNFIWDRRHFPDPKAMLARLKDKGLKICVWINPYIAQQSALFEEAMNKGYLLKKPNGDVWQWDLWQAGMGIVDFTNPDACRWFQGHLQSLIDMGVDSFKTDFGERIPTNVVYDDGSNPRKMHNYYAYLYNQVVYELLEREKGKEEAIVFARSATAGSQKFPVHWGGDCDSTYEAMAESLRGGLSLTTSGFGYWSHDIGGFENTATPDVFKRWTAFGLLSSHSRFHGSSSYRVPWHFDEEAVEVARYFTKLKNSLMPYLYSEAVTTSKTGIPMMRAMFLEFCDDPLCEVLDRQYMLGDSLLVAPIFNPEGLASFYLPEGRWTHLLTNEVVEGGKWIKQTYNYFSLPLFVRPHTILPVGVSGEKSDYDYGKQLTLRIYQVDEDARMKRSVVDSNGDVIGDITVERKHRQLTVNVDGIESAYQIDVVGHKTFSVEAGTHESVIIL